MDNVNKPQHYNRSKLQPIEVIEDWELDFRLANVIKYIYRYRYKGKPLEDLSKARFYLERYINELERKEVPNNSKELPPILDQQDVLQEKESKDQGMQTVERVYFPTAEGLVECEGDPGLQKKLGRLQTGPHEDNLQDRRSPLFYKKGRNL